MENARHDMERIVLDKRAVEEIEMDMLIRRHIERYALVRQYAFGKVLDAACGVGYGSYLVAKNPDVESIVGVDCDAETIEYAKKNFESTKIRFECLSFENVSGEFDMLISLETIEHLDDPKILAEMAERCHIKECIISFPSKKTTHYNKFHMWDFGKEDIEYIFWQYTCINEIQNGDSQILHFIKRDKNTCAPEKRYLTR